MRSQTVQIKKQVAKIKLSWREQRSRIHVDLIEHFSEKLLRESQHKEELG